MVSEENHKSGQGGDNAEPVASHIICTILSDAEIMQRKMIGISKHCHARIQLHLRDVRRRLEQRGIKLLLINQVPYRDGLTECEQCTYYLGDLPTWGEVQNRKK